jgi:hypothetical protein
MMNDYKNKSSPSPKDTSKTSPSSSKQNASHNKAKQPVKPFLSVLKNQIAVQNMLNSWVRQQGSIQLPKIAKRGIVNLNSSPTLTSSPSQQANKRFITSMNTMGRHTYRDMNTKATDFAPHSFYLDCINAVDRFNRPEQMHLSEPKELIYVRNLPSLKFIIFGQGKLINSMWEIRNIYAGAKVDTDEYSVFDHLSIRDKI